MSDESTFDLQPGEAFASYEIVRPLGRGAFGCVYEALRKPLGKRVALKVLHAQYAERVEVLERFLREAEIVAQLEHPHLVGAFDVGTERRQPYLAMEFLEGESLADRIDREPRMTPESAVDVMLAVCSALVAVHAKGIVHRDIKPANIFLARTAVGTSQPKLLDFGIAKVRDAERALTKTRAIVGTPHYMSPEQVRESKVITGASDQWSLAVVLYQCLVGTTPFACETMFEVFNAITTAPIAPMRHTNPEVPAGLDSVVARAFARDPERRHPSMRAFGASLLPYASRVAREHWAGFFAEAGKLDTSLVDPLAPTREPPKPASEPATLAAVESPVAAPSESHVAKRPRTTGALWIAAGLTALGIAGLSVRSLTHGAPGARAAQAPSGSPAGAASSAASSVASSAASSPTELPAIHAAPAPSATAMTAPTSVATAVAVATAAPSATASVGRHRASAAPRPAATAIASASAPEGSARPSAPSRGTAECPNGICSVD